MKREIINLDRIYKGYQSEDIIKGISLKLYDDDLVFITSPSDTELTTLAEILSGNLCPDSGEMFYLGKRVSFSSEEAAHKNGIHYITQRKGLIDSMTIGENICILRPKGIHSPLYVKKMNTIAMTVCRELDLGLNFETPIRDMLLSNFDEIAVQSMRAVFQRAKVIIYNNLLHLFSNKEILKFIEMLSLLKAKGILVCILDNLDNMIAAVSNRVLFMRDGMILTDFEGSSYTEKERNILLKTEKTYEAGPLSTIDRSNHEGQTFRFSFYKAKSQISYIDVKQGEVIGLYFSNTMDYYDLFQLFTNNQEMQRINSHTKRESWQEVVTITADDFYNGIFPMLSCKDNVLLPVLKQKEPFVRSAFASYPIGTQHVFQSALNMDQKQWNGPARKCSQYEKIQMTLYRYLSMNNRILFLSNLFIDLSPAFRDMLIGFIGKAIQRGRGVVIFEKNREILEPICDRVVNINCL